MGLAWFTHVIKYYRHIQYIYIYIHIYPCTTGINIVFDAATYRAPPFVFAERKRYTQTQLSDEPAIGHGKWSLNSDRHVSKNGVHGVYNELANLT